MIFYAPFGHCIAAIVSLIFLLLAAANWIHASQAPIRVIPACYSWEPDPKPRWVYLTGGMLWYTGGVIWLSAVLRDMPGLIYLSVLPLGLQRGLHPPTPRPYLQ